MYTPVGRKDLFNDSWFEISEIVDKGISHGIALSGISETLAKDFQEMIRDRNVQTKFLTDDDENHQQVIANEQAERRRWACEAASLMPREVSWQEEKSAEKFSIVLQGVDSLGILAALDFTCSFT